MPATKVSEILAHAICPDVVFEDNYEPFLTARSQMLVDAANGLMA